MLDLSKIGTLLARSVSPGRAQRPVSERNVVGDDAGTREDRVVLVSNLTQAYQADSVPRINKQTNKQMGEDLNTPTTSHNPI